MLNGNASEISIQHEKSFIMGLSGWLEFRSIGMPVVLTSSRWVFYTVVSTKVSSIRILVEKKNKNDDSQVEIRFSAIDTLMIPPERG